MPEIYFRIVLLALGRDCTVTAFTLVDFFADGGKGDPRIEYAQKWP